MKTLKEKQQLNSAYGIMWKNAMPFCASFVREVKRCRDCLHFAECSKMGMPAPLSARFVFMVKQDYIPIIDLILARVAVYSFKLKLQQATDAQEERGAVCSIVLVFSCYNGRKRKGFTWHRRVPVYLNESLEAVSNRVMRQYVKLARKVKE